MSSRNKSSSSSSSASRLFSTLASIEREDESATKRRRQSHLHSLHQSREASDQTKINSILLELRILTQRCLATTEEKEITTTTASSEAAITEVNAILEKLLVARRDLMGGQHRLVLLDTSREKGAISSSSASDEENSNDLEENVVVNYDELIRSHQASTMTNTVDDDDDGLTKHLQSEYSSLRNNWKNVLNKLHSNLTLHSGMSVNHSKFQSKAVDVSFWEQIQSGVHHERFQNQSTTKTMDIGERQHHHPSHLQFDDSKLYQQMLKDFISSSRSITSPSTNHREGMMDPAQEAAERLKRAMRKKTGGNGDIDLTSLLTEEEEYSVLKKKKKVTTDTDANAAFVDRRASKGRKIRYTVHPKLVNFTFPLSRPEPIISDDVWFKSLFGGVGNLS